MKQTNQSNKNIIIQPINCSQKASASAQGRNLQGGGGGSMQKRDLSQSTRCKRFCHLNKEPNVKAKALFTEETERKRRLSSESGIIYQFRMILRPLFLIRYRFLFGAYSSCMRVCVWVCVFGIARRTCANALNFPFRKRLAFHSSCVLLVFFCLPQNSSFFPSSSSFSVLPKSVIEVSARDKTFSQKASSAILSPINILCNVLKRGRPPMKTGANVW